MKKHTVFLIIAVLVGTLLGLQVKSFRKVALLVQRSAKNDVFGELRVLQIANSELRAHLEDEERKLEEATKTLGSLAIEEEIKRLMLLAGEASVSGEGVEVTLSGEVAEYWITDLIAQITSARAEAIAVNDIRLTAQTAGFRSLGGGLLMRRYFLKPPYRISAIGSRQGLRQAIAQNGGILDRIKDAYPGLQTTFAEREKILIQGASVSEAGTKKPAEE